MATEAPKCCNCCWILASYQKLQEDFKRVQEEKNHIKDLLWKSGGSWAEKEQAIQDDIIRASEEVVNDHGNGESN